MLIAAWLAVPIMLLVRAGKPAENPWQDKVGPAVAEARRAGTVKAFGTALDAAWRADDWQTGVDLARQALEKHDKAETLWGRVARAYWRAGLIADAERIVARLPAKTDDRVSLAMLILTHLARGEQSPASEAAQRLAALPNLSAENLFYVIGTRLSLGPLDGLSQLVRRAEKLTDADNGYPEIYVADQLQGLPEFLDAIGPAPLNQLTACGAAPMPPMPLINLPGCDVIINGHGPYRMIVDTGGSVTVSLDEHVAEEIGLKSISTSTVHGVSGRAESGQTLIDELKIGPITCRRVLTRIFAVRPAVAYAADGILGTGVLGGGRLTLNFETGRLSCERSAERPAPGREAELRIVGDAKLIVPVSLQGQPAAALLDTGADVFALSPARLKRIFPDRTIPSYSGPLLGVGHEICPVLSLAPGVEFVVAGRTYANYGGVGLDVLDTLLGPLLGVQADVLMGMPIMRQMRTLCIDFPRCKMWVDWLEPD